MLFGELNENMKRVFGFIIVIIVALLVSCGPNKIKVQNDNTISFTDALNRTITVTKKPSRVVALIGSFADVWMLSGGQICATAEDAWNDFNLELESAINIGGAHSPNLELLLSAEPDFVIASASTT